MRSSYVFSMCTSDSQVLTVAMSLFPGLGIYCVKTWPRDLLCNHTASRYALGSKPGSNTFLFLVRISVALPP